MLRCTCAANHRSSQLTEDALWMTDRGSGRSARWKRRYFARWTSIVLSSKRLGLRATASALWIVTPGRGFRHQCGPSALSPGLHDPLQLRDSFGERRRPGCRMYADLISCSCCPPAPRESDPIRLRAAIFSRRTGLPHHEPMMMSGAAAITCSLVTNRSLASRPLLNSGKTWSPAISTSSRPSRSLK